MNNLDTEYKKKYFKYKAKYLQLLSQIAGNSQENVTLVVSHQGRLKCMLSNLFHIELDKKFQNCCIIKLVLEPSNEKVSKYTLSMPYYGELTTTGLDQDKINSLVGNHYNNTNQFKDENGTIKLDLELTQKQIIYFVRHGDGTHLKAKREKTKAIAFMKAFVGAENELTDANLTTEGINQAQASGYKLNELLGETNINQIFVSDLRRTLQTAKGLLEKIDSKKINTKEVIVLPCIHELDFKKESKCDKCGDKCPFNCKNCDALQGVLLPENTPSVTNTILSNLIEKKNEEYREFTLNRKKFTVNWEVYKEFYKGTRKDNSHDRSHCQNESVLKLILKNINK